MQIGGHNLLWSNVPASDAKNKNRQEKLQNDLKHVYNKIGNVYIIKNIIFWNVMPCNLAETKLVGIYQITCCHIPHLIKLNIVLSFAAGDMIAIGSQNGSVYLFRVSRDGFSYKKWNKIRGSQPLTQLDWSTDGSYLQTVTADYDLVFCK